VGFPQTSAPIETSFSSDVTAHACDLPSIVNFGELLILLFSAEETTTTVFTKPSGWEDALWDTFRFSAHGACYIKKADGTEGGGTADVVTDVATVGSGQVYKVTNWWGEIAGVEVGVVVDDQSLGDSPDPPSLTPSWGALDTLWFAMFSCSNDDETVNAYPTNYGNGVDTISGGGENNGASVGSARRELNDTVDDPGAFTLSENAAWVANTLAVRPNMPADLNPALFKHMQRRSPLLRM